MNQALLRFDDLAARKDDPVLFARWLFSGSLAERPHGLDGMQFRCSLCMAVTRMARREGVEDLREGMPCATCGMSARLRSCLAMLGTLVEPSDRIYITEQGTPAFAWLQARYPHVRGSEFEPDADRRAALAAYLESLGGHGPIEFQDVTRLDMADDSLHAVACFDVLEHVDHDERVVGPDIGYIDDFFLKGLFRLAETVFANRLRVHFFGNLPNGDRFIQFIEFFCHGREDLLARQRVKSFGL